MDVRSLSSYLAQHSHSVNAYNPSYRNQLGSGLIDFDWAISGL